jgi:serine/threonine-protein kinase
MQSFGRYEIIEQLGQGSMGTVYKARDPIMDRDVAIKRILVQAGEGVEAAELRERFFREARAAGRLAHPGIVTVFDVSEHEGMPFLVMEYVAGRTLQSILQSGERLDLDRVCELGIELAEALNYAHQNSVFHRDIKPANILVTNDGRIKVADFGVAKLAESQVTVSGQLLGTPAFMAPEQFIGMPVDGRADLFSAGVVIYCMATGEKPFAGDTVLGVQYKVVHTDPLPPRKLNPAISPDLEAVILKSIEKDPARRYQSGEELARDLRAARAGEPISKTRTADSTQILERTSVVTPSVDACPQHRAAATPPAGRRANTALIVLIPFLVTFFAFTTFFWMKSWRQGPSAATNDAVTPDAPAVPAQSNPAPRVASESAAAQTSTSEEVPTDSVSRETKNVETVKEKAAGKRNAVIETSRSVQPERITQPHEAQSPAALPANQQNAQPAGIPVLPPPPEPIRHPVDELPANDNKAPVGPEPVAQEPGESYKSARLLIASSAMPEPLTIIVNVDNELLFTRNATTPPPFGFEDLAGRIRLQSVPSVPLSEERQIPAGKHKIQVNVLLGVRRVAKVQETTDRFYAGQRRVLQIEFLPESQGSGGRDSTLFKIKLR